MKGAIVYKGKYGATQQYAEWLGSELQLPVLKPENVTASNLALYDFIIIGSPVYIGSLLIKKWLKKYAGSLQNKKVFVFIVCATPATESEKLNTIVTNNIPETILKAAGVYFFPGRMIIEKLSWRDKFMLTIGTRLQKDAAVKKAMLQNFDDVKKERITELVNAVKTFIHEKNIV
jgi:menaquinone-dependent protoporphyrinogen IX oxidase